MQGLKEIFRAWRNRTTIRKQLSLLLSLAVVTTVGLQVAFTYATLAHAYEKQQIDALSRVLMLERQRLDAYVTELGTFSLQLRSNADFMEIAAETVPLTHTQRQSVETALKGAFYARGDLVTLEVFLVRQRQCYAMDSALRKVTVTDHVEVTTLPDYGAFTAKPAFFSIKPSANGFLRFTRALIDAPRTTPLAVVRFTVDGAAIETLRANHAEASEQVCVFGGNGETYAAPEGFSTGEIAALFSGVRGRNGSFTATIGGEKNLCVATAEGTSGMVLVCAKPIAVVNATLNSTRNGSIAIGLLVLLATLALSRTFIRFVTEPLSRLAQRLRRVGQGNFSTRTKLEGSFELIGLSDDVNRMIGDIDGLIERTYVATLNERTAQLAALEAQTNPHFLFNTLQAIGTEALQRGQTELYRMITALAALLRYSIRGGNLVRLETELGYVEKYLSLQKARFGERLTYRIHVDPALIALNVPKLGVLSLVENAIVHGMSDWLEPVTIQLEGTVEGDQALLTVSDDGAGIAPDKLATLRNALESANVMFTQGVGLMNLSSRLRLLYNGSAKIILNSGGEPRRTTVSLWIPLEVVGNV